MNEMNNTLNYIELQLSEANNKLDTEWEERKARSGASRRLLTGLNSDDVFAAMLNNHKIVQAEQRRVTQLLQVSYVRLIGSGIRDVA